MNQRPRSIRSERRIRPLIPTVVQLAVAAVALVSAGTLLGYNLLYPKPDSTVPVVVNVQSFTPAQRNDFYHLAEGSEVFPLFIAQSLSDPQGGGPFLANLERYGFIADPEHSGGQLPYVGLTVQPRRGLGSFPMIGVNCAACHVGQIEYQHQKLRIDGAPNMLNVVNFFNDLRTAMRGLGTPRGFGLSLFHVGMWYVGTLRSEDRFVNRFKGISQENLEQIVGQFTDIQRLQKQTNPWPLAGRSDAFNTARSIFFGDFAPISAPTSAPFIWGLQHTEWYHWSANTNSILERNIGQALALGAGIDPETLTTTIDFDNLEKLEELAGKIKTPVWPSELGFIQTDKISNGLRIYVEKCAGCHDSYKELPGGQAGTMLYEYTMIELRHIGTDPNEALTMEKNGRPVFLKSNVCDQNVPTQNTPGCTKDLAEAHELLIGAIIKKAFSGEHATEVNARNGYRGSTDSMKWRAVKDCRQDQKTPEIVDQDSKLDSYENSVCAGYPAKPLAGIWATAPYLHNGSVASISELLKSDKERMAMFYVGQREYDPENLGYTQRAPFDKQTNVKSFDARKDGNRNLGHNYATTLQPGDKLDLIEFLKYLGVDREQEIHKCEIEAKGQSSGQVLDCLGEPASGLLKNPAPQH